MDNYITSLKETNLEKTFILNPWYILRHDVNRIILTASGSNKFKDVSQPNISTFIHPIYAMLLSFFKGDKKLKSVLEEVAYFFDITIDKAYELIEKFLNNKEQIAVEYDNRFFYFPPEILIENKNYDLRNYSVHDFNLKGKLDFESVRYNIPIDGSILINTRCATDCIYCYADKRKIYDCSIPWERIKEIIKEARDLKLRNFDIQGGEVFMYEHWEALLTEYINSGFSVYLSTKCPLTEEQIFRLKDTGTTEIQVSLDSIFANDLIKNLRVSPSYPSKILKTIELLNKYGFTIKLKPVITGAIFDIKRLEEYIDYFKKFENVKILEFTVPTYSRFKTDEDFQGYKLSKDNIYAIENLVSRKREECHFILNFDGSQAYDEPSLSFEEKRELWIRRSRCTGNQSSFIILPNGDVTICEEAYFNKNLIMGNILEDSIMEMWNSERAKNLFYISQSVFPKDSPCADCKDFEDCRHTEGVCWVDAMSDYGEENWLYPDPDCPYAPPKKSLVSIE